MAAADSTLSRCNKQAFFRQMQRYRRALNYGDSNPDGMFFPFDSGNFTPASTETDDINDQIDVIEFPNGAKLVHFQIVSTAEVDSGGTAWVYDVIATDDSTDTTLISGCTVGRGDADKDEMTVDLGNYLLDVGGQTLSLKTTTPPTANAGTGVLRIKGLVFMGDLLNISA